MKLAQLSMAALVALLSLGATAEPVSALLRMKNLAGPKFDRPLASVVTRFSAALSGDVFNVSDAADVIGNDVGSATDARLAELLGERVLLTVSVDSCSAKNLSAGVKRLQATVSLQAKNAGNAAAVVGATRTVQTRSYTAKQFDENIDAVYDELIGKAVEELAPPFLEKARRVTWASVAEVPVQFGCNFAGANVAVDGVTYGFAGEIGQAPLKVSLRPGVHSLRVTTPLSVPFEGKIMVRKDSTFVVQLVLNAEGREQLKRDAVFHELMDRVHESGATDDMVRRLKAEGYSKYLSASCHRIDGMPQQLTLQNSMLPDPGLTGNAVDSGVKSTESLIQEVKGMTK